MPDRRLEWTNYCWEFSGVQPYSSCQQNSFFPIYWHLSHTSSSFLRSVFYLTSCLDIKYFSPSFIRQTSCTDGNGEKKRKKGEHLDRLWHQDCAAGLLLAALPLCVRVGMWMWARVLTSSLSNILKVALFLKCFNSLLGHMLPFFVLGGVIHSAGHCHDFTAGARPCLVITWLKVIQVNKTRSIVAVKPVSPETSLQTEANLLRPLVSEARVHVCTHTHGLAHMHMHCFLMVRSLTYWNTIQTDSAVSLSHTHINSLSLLPAHRPATYSSWPSCQYIFNTLKVWRKTEWANRCR